EQISGMCEHDVARKLDEILAIMETAVNRGIHATGRLPGPIGLERKAAGLYEKARSGKAGPDKFFVFLDAYAMATAEENAAGSIVVTAPTSGSAGVVPGMIYLLKHHFNASRELLHEGMLVAAVIAFITKHNASIAGAEVGCQGEIGVASSMAAALLAHVNGQEINVVENAAEIALEHHLGLTCDPVRGYVQIPCIERNAVAAVEAYNAYLLASSGDPKKQKISFDEVVEAMLKTGRDMSMKYKETSEGGLAVCAINC
ncbi:MAG: L-serine ammonia-lyase, iron-sulfur-dependent, subunit alpha, partial [Candidatus Omnitrophota bacterium]